MPKGMLHKVVIRVMTTLAVLTISSPSSLAATKDTGASNLKDVQPAGTTDKKNKKQQYDLNFVSPSGTDYTCRTHKTKLKATDIVVGTSITYEVKGDKGKIKTAAGKKFDCTIVRIANGSTAPPSN